MSDLFRAATSAALPTFFHVGGSVVALGLVVFGAFSVEDTEENPRTHRNPALSVGDRTVWTEYYK